MAEKKERLLEVSAIENGTVIDHIPSKSLFKVISILNLEKIDSQITFGANFKSKKLGSKAIIKITNKFFEQEEINKIAILAPDAKLSIIKDYEVIEKQVVQLPDTIFGITKCFNPMCITNHEKVTPKYSVLNEKTASLKCEYCGKITEQNNFVFI